MSQLHDVVSNSVKEKLQRGEVVASITVRLVPTVEIVRIARARASTASTSTSSTRVSRCRPPAALHHGARGRRAAFVRVPANTPNTFRACSTAARSA
jgi:hypothetical protein